MTIKIDSKCERVCLEQTIAKLFDKTGKQFAQQNFMKKTLWSAGTLFFEQ